MLTNRSGGNPRWTRGVALGAAVLAGTFLFWPAAAEAKDEFERAFKFELGRIAAHEAVHAGRHILGAIVLGPSHPYGHRRHPYRHYSHHPSRHYGYRHHGPPYGYAYGHPIVHEHHHYYHFPACGYAGHEVHRHDDHRTARAP